MEEDIINSLSEEDLMTWAEVIFETLDIEKEIEDYG